MPAGTTRTINIDGQIYQTVSIDSTGTASTAVALPFQTIGPNNQPNPSQHVFLTASGDDIVFKFGASDVAASASVSNSLLAPFNIIVLEGQTKATDLNGATQTYVSVISGNDTSGGTAYIELMNVNV